MHLTLTVDENGVCDVVMAEGLSTEAAAKAIGIASSSCRTVCKQMAEHIEASFGVNSANRFFAIAQKYDRETGETSGTILMDGKGGGERERRDGEYGKEGEIIDLRKDTDAK